MSFMSFPMLHNSLSRRVLDFTGLQVRSVHSVQSPRMPMQQDTLQMVYFMPPKYFAELSYP